MLKISVFFNLLLTTVGGVYFKLKVFADINHYYKRRWLVNVYSFRWFISRILLKTCGVFHGVAHGICLHMLPAEQIRRARELTTVSPWPVLPPGGLICWQPIICLTRIGMGTKIKLGVRKTRSPYFYS